MSENAIANNEWHDRSDLGEVIETILNQSSKDSSWEWYKNSQCKYVSIKFDMRDGGFAILNRDGKPITLNELKRQGYL